MNTEYLERAYDTMTSIQASKVKDLVNDNGWEFLNVDYGGIVRLSKESERATVNRAGYATMRRTSLS